MHEGFRDGGVAGGEDGEGAAAEADGDAAAGAGRVVLIGGRSTMGKRGVYNLQFFFFVFRR